MRQDSTSMRLLCSGDKFTQTDTYQNNQQTQNREVSFSTETRRGKEIAKCQLKRKNEKHKQKNSQSPRDLGNGQ
jgi:hypothetical protein